MQSKAGNDNGRKLALDIIRNARHIRMTEGFMPLLAGEERAACVYGVDGVASCLVYPDGSAVMEVMGQPLYSDKSDEMGIIMQKAYRKSVEAAAEMAVLGGAKLAKSSEGDEA